MKLTKEYIKLIDNYFIEIGVEYLDIRIEMVDHLATEIEENIENVNTFFNFNGFQTPFVKYMYANKDRFIKLYKKQVRKRTWDDIRSILTNTIAALFTKVGLLIVFTMLLIGVFQKELDSRSFQYLVLLILGLQGVFMVINTINRKLQKIKLVQTYYSISSIIFYVIIITTNPLFKDKTYSTGFRYSIFGLLGFFFLLHFAFFKIKKQNLKNYKQLLS